MIPILAVLTSCNNKVSDSTPQYLRGGNSLLADGGNLIIAGYTSTSTRGFQATLVSFDPSVKGDTNWTHTYGGSYSDAFFCVKKSKDGYIATGFSNAANGGAPSMLVVFTDNTGKQLKALTYGGSANTQGISLVQNADSGYLVAGFIQKSGSDRDAYLVRLKNDKGDTLWTKTIGAKGDPHSAVNDAAYGVIAAPGGGYFITGALNSGYNMEGSKIFLMKISAAGKNVWAEPKVYGSGFGYSLTLTRDGGVAISGSTINGSNQDVFLVKTDTAGNLFPGWAGPISYGGSGFEYGASMIETSDGGFAVTGITETVTNGLQDVYLVRTSSLGVKTYEKNFGESDNEQGYGLIQSGTDFYITGLSNTGGSYIYLNKVDMNGGQVAGWPKLIQ